MNAPAIIESEGPLDGFTPEDFLNRAKGILTTKGFELSAELHLAVDVAGEPLPWFSYPAIDFLTGLDFSDRTIFEFGAGCSTLWWAARVKSVTSVENNAEWFERLSPHAPENCKLFFMTEQQSYLDSINEEGRTYDVIVVDGDAALNRRRMAEAALQKLAPGGFIILDNSDCHIRAGEVLRGSGLIQIDMIGLAPGNMLEQGTSLFLSRDYNFKPLGMQPKKTQNCMPHIVDE